MTSEKDTRPPWIRAGGYPHSDWHKCVGLATERHVAADEAVRAYLQPSHAFDFAEFARLRADAEAARETWRNVLDGDPETVGHLFGEVLEQEQRDRRPPEREVR